MSRIITTGRASLSSAVTGEIFEVAASELQWEIGDRGDRRIGAEVHHIARVERVASDGTIIACQWTVAEFPPGTLSHSGLHSVGGIVSQNFRFSLTAPWRK